jgi:hypothetical protein
MIEIPTIVNQDPEYVLGVVSNSLVMVPVAAPALGGPALPRHRLAVLDMSSGQPVMQVEPPEVDWDNRPHPQDYPNGSLRFRWTDPNGNVVKLGRWVSTGTRWIPDSPDRRVYLGGTNETYEFPNDLLEHSGKDIYVPPGLLQCGMLEADMLVEFTGSTNTKTLRIAHQDAYYPSTDFWVLSAAVSGASNVIFQGPPVRWMSNGHELHARCLANGQAVGAYTGMSQAAIDTSYLTKVQFRAQKSVATEQIKLHSCRLWAVINP